MGRMKTVTKYRTERKKIFNSVTKKEEWVNETVAYEAQEYVSSDSYTSSGDGGSYGGGGE